MAKSRNLLIRRLLFGAGVLFYLASAALAVIGSEGLFGMTADPFASLFLLLAGAPWSLALTPFLLVGLPVWIGQIGAFCAPLINLRILWRLCFGRRDKA